MQDYSHSQFNLSGYQFSTTNKDHQAGKDIMAAWGKVRSVDLASLIQGVANNETLYCMYYNYQNPENPDQRSYDFLIGYETEDGAVQTISEIVSVSVPAQNYKYDTVEKDNIKAFLSKWAEINSMDDLNRTFGFDMDMYGKDGVTIAVSVE